MFDEDKGDYLQKMEHRRQRLSENHECRYRRKDGGTLWALVSSTPILDDAGHFNGMFAMITDITERKRAEQMLLRREQEYRTLVENIPDLMCWKRPSLGKVAVI